MPLPFFIVLCSSTTGSIVFHIFWEILTRKLILVSGAKPLSRVYLRYQTKKSNFMKKVSLLVATALMLSAFGFAQQEPKKEEKKEHKKEMKEEKKEKKEEKKEEKKDHHKKEEPKK
jgi:mannitol-specific phosphotransferase system IIBC component